MADIRNDPSAWGIALQTPYQAQVIAAELPLLNQEKTKRVSTLLYGQIATVHGEADGWALVSGVHDDYLGFAELGQLNRTIHQPNARIGVRSTHLYSKPDIKSLPRKALSLGAQIQEIEQAGDFVVTNEGYVFAAHIAREKHDPVDWAARFLGTPYLWGGGSSTGIDCSGIVQLAFALSGYALPRDSDQQEDALSKISPNEIKRNDLVFWKGHVGLIEDDATLIHATAWKMQTIREPLHEAIARIGKPTSFRRVSGQ